ncbi:hypothetical protein [Nocardia beijingensis]|uniref:hypothetical protein n=1 Tax=Nocardia beijingensis TaxID=95162 RepID=UPI0033B48EAC
MKRADLLRKIARAAQAAGLLWEIAREGNNHTIYKLDGKQIPVGRHTELDDLYAEKVYKQCEDKLGKGWWR